MRVRTAEKDTQRLILDWLAAKRIWHIRLNTGAMSGSHKGKRWFVKFGKPGMADILIVIGRDPLSGVVDLPPELTIPPRLVWCEVKSSTGKLSEAQEQFRKEVTEQGMQYICARSLEDVQKVVEG